MDMILECLILRKKLTWQTEGDPPEIYVKEGHINVAFCIMNLFHMLTLHNVSIICYGIKLIGRF